MATPVLALNPINGTTPQVRRYANATPATVGVTFGTLDVGAGVGHHFQKRVIQFGGDDTWLAAVGTQIYRTTDGGASWASVHTLTINASTVYKSGIHVIHDNGVPTLCIVYLDTNVSAQLWRYSTSLNGTAWTESGTTNLGGFPTTAVFVDERVYHGSLFLWVNSNGTVNSYKMIVFSLSGGTLTALAAVPNFASGVGLSNSTGALCVFNDQLLFLYGQASGTVNYVLAEITGGTTVPIVALGAANTPFAAAGCRYAMFVDGANLYCFVYHSIALGWKCFQVSSTFTVTEITSTVIPLPMTGTTSGGNSPITSKVWPFVDHEAAIGSGSPTCYLGYSSSGTAGTSTILFRWNGNAALMTTEDSGGDVVHAVSALVSEEGGEYAWTNGERHIEWVSRVAVIGGERRSFKLFSPSGTDVVNVRGWVGTAATEYPSTAMVFSSPSAGTLGGPGGNTVISGLTADNGATTYQVTFVAGPGGNGFSNAQRARRRLEVYS